MIKVTLKDGSVREFENELSVMDIAKSISEGLARAVVAASVNGKVVGLNHIVKEDCELNLFKFDDEEGNIKNPITDHIFEKGNCIFCGISEKSKYNDPSQRETYAYEFIHFNKISSFLHLVSFSFEH